MKAVACQLNLAWEDPEANYRKARDVLASLGDMGGGLLVLPEMFPTGFSMNVATVIEPEASRTEAFLAGLAKQKNALVIAGLAHPGEKDKGRNVAVAIAPDGQTLCRYQKIHPFSLAGEASRFERGRSVETFEWRGLSVAPLICYDLRFPEPFRKGVDKGAQVFAVIANWPAKRDDHWITLLRARAIENQAYVIGVNRCGTDPDHPYTGRSMIVDPHGRVLADAGNGEGYIQAEILAAEVEAWRGAFPALADRHM